MKFELKNIDQLLNLTIPSDFKPDLGKEENLKEFEEETLRDVINPIENYETIRLNHKPYGGQLLNPTDLQMDIWYYFYFYNNSPTPSHTGGLDYNLIGIDPAENAKMLKQSTKSFFRLEFYKTPEDELPERMNRRLVFAKNLSLPLGERVYYTAPNPQISGWISDFIYVPIFMGSNYRNKENMYLFWFQDDTALTETILTGDTFYMSARFFNADDGSISNFTNKSLSQTDNVDENKDLYFLVEFNKDDGTYQVFEFINGTKGSRIGTSDNPIKFYEIIGAD